MSTEIRSNRSSSSSGTNSTGQSEKSGRSEKSDRSSGSDRAEEARKAAEEARKAAEEARKAAEAALKARTAAEARRLADQAKAAQGRAQVAQQRAQASVDALKRELTTATPAQRPAVESSLRQAQKSLTEAKTSTLQASAASTQASTAARALEQGQSSFTPGPTTPPVTPRPTPVASSPSPTATPTANASPTPTATPTSAVAEGGTASKPRPIGYVDQEGQVPERQLDGAVIGAGGAAYASGTDAYSTTPVGPTNGKPATETVIYVNGIQNTANVQYGSMQTVANELGANVYGIHNSTAEDHPLGSFVGDLVQCLTDKTGRVPNSATSALALQVVKDLEAGRPVHLMAHSQGALVTSNALSATKEYLLHERQPPLSEAAVDKMMSRIKVETFGGAAASYPYGPQYVHYINTFDTVPMNAGLGSYTDAYLRQMQGGGDRATFHFIHDDPRTSNPLLQNNLTQIGELIPAHDFNQGYMAHRMPFNEGHASNADLSGASPVLNVPGHEGEAAYYSPAPPSGPEAARRRAGQAESDSALARAQAEAAAREARAAAASGDPARAAQAAARAEQAANRAVEAFQRAQEAAKDALRETGADPAAGIGWVPGGAPPAAAGSVVNAAQAERNMNEALRVAREAREQATRAAA
ncbi:hypothetical protein [Hyalangium gracile]|uniref:hypothetical protein n=1 Tax=Hyalangium gracile TaxID=394092 RepID=UPI001CCC6D90|nr:hypothetical protein [Hyalangium gracile]